VNAPDGKPYYVMGEYLRDQQGQLIPDKNGAAFRLCAQLLTRATIQIERHGRAFKKPMIFGMK
ncbi:MAG: hypothetical protein PHS31_09880, partial [Victivallaceae bacterium]|nr:hypothetical protein [Victivallaceae bacterium]